MGSTSMTPSRLRRARKTGPEPRYDLRVLLIRVGHTWEEFGLHVGISRATAHRRLQNGVTWGQADDYAIAYGFFPGEVWPEWEEADPATWCDLSSDGT